MKALHSRITAAGALIAASAIGTASAGIFPDFGYQPPATEYSGPLFQLSQNYPQQMPPASAAPAFFKLLPKTLTPDMEAWRPYMMAVRNYCLEGNVKVDWRVQDNPVRHWYHIPWQHYGPFECEGIHGLTKEAQIKPKQLAPTQVTSGQTYAVGIYNEFGGYVIGQAWKDPQNPNPAVTSKPNSFPNGTVVCKAPAGQPFSAGAKSTDYSLQLAISMQNFYSWKCDQGGVFARGGNACAKAAPSIPLLGVKRPYLTCFSWKLQWRKR